MTSRMAKIKTLYVCQNCGFSSAKWLGRCTSCQSWSSFEEEKPSIAASAPSGSLSAAREDFKDMRSDMLADAGDGRARFHAKNWVPLDEAEEEDADSETLNAKKEKSAPRLSTGIGELDRVLGGGMVRDSFTLLGGDPGIGKSTLLLQMAGGVLRANPTIKFLYVTGEESIEQIRSRAKRLGVGGKGRVFLAAETQLEQVIATIKELRPHVIVMDSLQTFSSSFVDSSPGNVAQVREITQRLMALAKTAGVAVWLVGHVTKEGSIAGPKVVEHMVDTVLYFEGEEGQSFRLLRTVKNRFGSTRELGVFEMDGEGLREVLNPSQLFLSERQEAVSGTAVAASLEGSRPLLVELQALVAPSALAVPRRTSVGMDTARIALLAAILERHMGLSIAQQDLFFNVAGGLKLSEPACDLAAAAAIWSSREEYPIKGGWIFMGELGLTGEVRRVSQLDIRVQEAKKLGFSVAVVPASTPKQILDKCRDIKIILISRVSELKKILN